MNNADARKIVSGILLPPARLLIRLHVSPDAITVLGTVAAVLTALICFPQGYFVAGTLLITFFALADLLDGTMARLSGTSGPWGNFLDATLDRIADGAIFAGFIWWALNNDNVWVGVAASLALVTGQVTSYAKARAEAVGATANVGIAERAERLIVILTAAFFTGLGVPYILPIALWIIGGLGLITVVQRIIHVRGQLRL
ncbi:MAG: CDP-alcohol phosphatidyltransferase family protein [Actinobacteria bacterium]|nr:CDP-alcohol phosphatidyltransferase family protein [Actinomycetota bacterium]MSY39169.1 CDP-alcohol phosphatidyltransferase family protein [Actinomycetota bacterium]MSZ42073.1 CDP-alcohol phosphatidyltransferase family protein [Actinomycetota bacterium]